MIAYLARRLLQTVLLLAGMSMILFLMMRVAPGDPVLAMYGGQPGVTPQMVQTARTQFGFDKPIVIQYVNWATSLLRGNLGASYINHSTVVHLLAEKLPASLELAAVSMVLSFAVAVPLGVLAASHRGSLVDHLVTGFVTMGIAIPSFWLGIMLALLFAVVLAWLPSAGHVSLFEDPLGNLRFVILPAVTLAVALAAPVMRFVRSSMLDVLQEPYIQTARAMGVSERSVVYRHALGNAILPAITVMGLQLGTLMGGAVIVEWVFAWPGIGWLLIFAITSRDYAVVQGAVLLIITIFVLVNTAVDVLYTYLDPRIRLR